MHINAVLKDISETVLIDLPEDHPSSLQDLIDTNEVGILVSCSNYLFVQVTILLIISLVFIESVQGVGRNLGQQKQTH